MRCCFFVEISALLPLAEVGLVDGLGGEMGGEDGLDFRQLVEPGEEVLGQLAVLEAQIELPTDGQREAGDFAVASHRGLRDVPLFPCVPMITGMRQD